MRDTNIYQKAEQMLLEYEGLHKMRNTPERLLILKKITKKCGRFTPADVVSWVKEDFISPATVYNTLNLLESARILHCLRKQHSSRLMEYELALGEQSSMQIICTKCGRVSVVKDKSTETALLIKKYPNFIMQHYSVYVFGECKHCKKL
ncbi:MAG: transcriptional repressor [Paludibacteraceae bacterium]|nr:transcriptional repressor [Paludibacteraceae bacterium]